MRERVSQATCDAHISLTVPLPREPCERDREELAAAVAAIAPLTIRYGPATTCLPRRRSNCAPGNLHAAGAGKRSR